MVWFGLVCMRKVGYDYVVGNFNTSKFFKGYRYHSKD